MEVAGANPARGLHSLIVFEKFSELIIFIIVFCNAKNSELSQLITHKKTNQKELKSSFYKNKF
ncbi:MAG: hypothetical protein DRO04_01540 [Candidatus Iainarchaeum archaeon]|uniref:Uncharacterized protein n=1 Tax=Candidatus Iainarchaeum sp. TaxID=3101447 RepID=A0A497JI79_9ARCH|nr:MAG: hypothetical protein DRO04_01540 [Candidatus Diapherotrites archaeon]